MIISKLFADLPVKEQRKRIEKMRRFCRIFSCIIVSDKI